MSATTTTTQLESSVVNTSLNYYLEPSLGGHSSYQVGTASYYRRKFDPHDVQIHDLRGKEDQYKLDSHGFQHAKHTSAETKFDDNERVKQIVYPETEQLIKDVTGATRVHVFSNITRRDSRDDVEKKVANDPDLQNDNASVQQVVPARFIHIDFSDAGALEILQDNFDKELGRKLSQSRWAIINVWRAIKPISKDPLAVCDARTVREEDLVPIVSYLPPKGSGQYADFSGGDRFELLYKRYKPDERWYYVDRMQPEEVLMIKIFDSLNDGNTARRCPHTAFSNPKTAYDAARESVEVRCLVFFEEQDN